MDGGHGTLVTGIHGLQHVERLVAADLADDDPVRPHAKTVDQELSLAHGSQPLHIWRPGLEAHDILVFELQFGGVFDGDDPLGLGNKAREDVHEM
jgi:hypothetical protein